MIAVWWIAAFGLPPDAQRTTSIDGSVDAKPSSANGCFGEV
jgi:hypothetical protein